MNFQFPDDKEERVPKVKIPHEQESLKLTIAATDKAIDALVYELQDIPETRFGLWKERAMNETDQVRILPKAPGIKGRRFSEVRGEDGPVKLLSGGNPQIAKADGAAPVQAYIAAMPGWKRSVGKRLDAVIVRHVPAVRKAVKWNSPFYGIEGQGWFLSFHVFTHYVKVTFFRGASLRPVPPGGTVRSKDTRWIDIHEGDFDEAQMAKWVKQAAALPGWIP